MNDNEWIKARIKPQDVQVRRVTNPGGEPIAREGKMYVVKFGHYIVLHADGTLWQCSPESLAKAYELLEAQP